MSTAVHRSRQVARALLMPGACLVMITLAGGTADFNGDANAAPVRDVAHDVHLSFTRITVHADTIDCRIRLFTSDIQYALGRLTGRDSVIITASAADDSLFARYFARAFPLVADGTTLPPAVIDRGEERDSGGEPMRWYTIRLIAPTHIRALSLRAAVLFELFRDQRNVVQVVDAATDRRTSFYFAGGDTSMKSVTF